MSDFEGYDINEETGRLNVSAGDGLPIRVEGVDEMTIQFSAGVGGDYDFHVSMDGVNWILVAEQMTSTHLLLTSNDAFATDTGGVAGPVIKCIPRPCAYIRFTTGTRGTGAGGRMGGARYVLR